MDCICGPLLFRLLISSVSIAVIQNWAIKCVCRVTTCLENVEMSGNLIVVRNMSSILLKVREGSENNLVREKWPKTVYY